MAEHLVTRAALWAIIPVKRLAVAKQRLGSVLGVHREEFARTLACRSIQTVLDSRQFHGVLVVTPDPLVALDAKARGAVVLDDGGGSLNAACSLGRLAAIQRGADSCVLIPADLALLTPDGLARLVADYAALTARSGRDSVGLVRCKEGTGTNMVFFGRQQEFAPAFGPDSFAEHMRGAAQPACELLSEEAAFDIDTAEDFRRLHERLHALPSADPIAQFMTSLQDTQQKSSRRVAHAARSLVDAPLAELTAAARVIRDRQHGSLVTYSRKVFIPLTQLCRDVCHYCTFAKTPKEVAAAYMSVDAVVAVATQGAKLGCKEALFTLGEKPEIRYRAAREWLAAHGFSSTLEYVAHAAAAVRDRTGLLPHINAGCMNASEMTALRRVSASMGLMLESAAERLCDKGGPHYGSPDKQPSVRLATIAEAGRQKIPFTTGLLIGIGETRSERIDALLALRDLHDQFGHIQEIIIQNFVPKPDTVMAKSTAASADELLWTIAVARILFGEFMSIQAPPNLSPVALPALIEAGINDWGGVSPLTPDYVNPEAPWPEIERLGRETAVAGKHLAERLTIYPAYAQAPIEWLDLAMRRVVLEQSDAAALGRENSWRAGRSMDIPSGGFAGRPTAVGRSRLALLVDEIRDRGADHLDIPAWASLFDARGADFHHVCAAADDVRAATNGDKLTYVVNRNINYTNICSYRCTFCAFSKGTRKHEGAERPYLLDLDVLTDRVREARQRGATEVCLQGGIHPDFTGLTYLEILRTVKRVDPAMHVHAFSPLEVWHGATTLGLGLKEYLSRLRDDGLGSLPGTAAEILHDPVRQLICPDKLTTDLWLEVVGTAHAVGLRTTATIMFGHLDRYTDWAIHLMRLRDLQKRTAGFTEFVPLPFVAHEAPMYKRGHARPGPTLREALLMHAVARLTLYPGFVNIQASWVKMGHAGLREALRVGANDIGGTLMNESISRAAGAMHGQEMTVVEMHAMAASLGRRPTRRTTLYGQPAALVDPGQQRMCDPRTADASRFLSQQIA
jgi:FO synthase